MKRAKMFYQENWLNNVNEYMKDYDFWHDGIIEKLENEVLKICKRKYAIACNSTTNAIMLSLYYWKKKHPKRNQVIIPNWGYPAAYQVCKFLDLNPVLVDIDRCSFSMDLDELYLNLKNETLAVVHIGNNGIIGNSPYMKETINNPNVLFIEDSAPSLLQDRAGTYGDIAMFSFSPTKPFQAGEGSVMVIDDEELYINIKKLVSNHDYNTVNLSLNCALSPILAAFLIPQFEYFDLFKNSRKWIHEKYKENIYETNFGRMFEEYSNYHGTIMYWSFKAEEISKALTNNNIQHRYRYYPCISKDKTLHVSHETYESLIDLPMHHELTVDDIKWICEIVKGAENG